MREEQITLGTREQTRVRVLNRLLAGEWTRAQAGLALERSTRQVRRLLSDYRAQGVEALLHGNRGRATTCSRPPCGSRSWPWRATSTPASITST